MANIMLTYRCNLHCPYCFANEFVNHSDYDISMSNFKTALSFLKTSNNRHIGLIGGEPTIHHEFKDFLQILSDDPDIESVTIYTNGLQMDDCLTYMTNSKFGLLVNCNSPVDIGQRNFDRLCANLEKLFEIPDVWKRVNLGINLYSDSLDYSYIINLLTRYKLHRVRMSVTVPNLDESKKANSLDYLQSRKDYTFRFIMECVNNDIAPYFDCNVIPKCVWSEQQLSQIEKLIEKFKLKRTNLNGDPCFCRPVIDILPDLNAVRCFGTSDFTKAPIKDFRCLDDLQNYYVNLIDCHVTGCMVDSRCRDCYERKVLRCTAGCLAFLRDGLIEANKE